MIPFQSPFFDFYRTYLVPIFCKTKFWVDCHFNGSLLNLISYSKQFTVLLGLSLSANLFAQDHLDWATLADVKFEQVFSEELGFQYDVATFGPFISLYKDKEVKIT